MNKTETLPDRTRSDWKLQPKSSREDHRLPREITHAIASTTPGIHTIDQIP